MIKWVRTSRFSIKNSLSVSRSAWSAERVIAEFPEFDHSARLARAVTLRVRSVVFVA